MPRPRALGQLDRQRRPTRPRMGVLDDQQLGPVRGHELADGRVHPPARFPQRARFESADLDDPIASDVRTCDADPDRGRAGRSRGARPYGVFLLSNSSAASLGGVRPAEVAHEHQRMLNLVIETLGLAGFLVGVILVAGLLGPLGFGVVLALIGVGMTVTALGFRRSLVAA